MADKLIRILNVGFGKAFMLSFDSEEAKKLLNRLGLKEAEIVDINLYSPSLGDIENFSNVDFNVNVPIDTSKIGKEDLYAYYVNDDGSVDFFNLNTMNHVKKDDLLARLTREDPGEYGVNVCGEPVKPRDVKRLKLRYGRNVYVNEDHTEAYCEVNGHVTLVDDKIFVSDVYTAENVDNSTGDINYEGTVKISGNVLYPNTVTYRPDMTVSDYVIMAGGYGFRSKKNKAYIIYMNGTVSRARRYSKGVVEPGCEIVVPKKRERKGALQEVLGVATTASSLATMMATIGNLLK